MGTRRLVASGALVGVAVCSVAPTAAQGPGDGEWRTYAADVRATKYSPLAQITAENFADLEVAWSWRTADTHLVHGDDRGTSLSLQPSSSNGWRPRNPTAG